MRTILISGGSSGIGQACAIKFIKNDDFVFNLDLVDCDIFTNFYNYRYIKTNVKSHDNITKAIDEVIAITSKIDVLIASAGKHFSANIAETSDEELIDIIQLNLFGCFWLIKESIEHMKKNNNGKIITIGSDQSLISKYNSCAYGMTKAALLSLTRSIALDYAQFNITANCIAAGTIDTPLYRNAINAYSKSSGVPLSEIERNEAMQQPVKRIGRPEEVAELAFFLSSDVNFITGAALPIDGGFTAQ